VQTLAEAVPAACRPGARDPELARLLRAVEQRLRAMERRRGIDRDVALAAVESYVAPYALALYYEICRLDDICDMPNDGRDGTVRRRVRTS
jgi:hypothetical protein